MVSETPNLPPTHQTMETNTHTTLNTPTPVFHQEQQPTAQFNHTPPPPPPPLQEHHHIINPAQKPIEMNNFTTHKIFPLESTDRYFSNPNWNHHDGSTDGSVGSSDADDDEDDEGFVGSKNDNSSGSVHSSNDKDKHDNILAKEGNCNNNININIIRGGGGSSSHQQQQQQGRGDCYENAVAINESEMYYSQFLHGNEGGNVGHKDIGENGKEGLLSVESGEPLRAILSDPITGTLMDDAMILPCGHSFGSGGLQHVIRMKACYSCSQSVTEDSFAPNLSLRFAIQAFRREEDLHSCRASKRKRDRLEQDKSSCGDLSMYISRGKGVQFPFAVTDRVVIKGNKRTPLRFVGREAVVTTQCLNGWYVVKTLDNAESVKLQYRSLAKVSDSPSSNMNSSKTTPSWL